LIEVEKLIQNKIKIIGYYDIINNEILNEIICE